MFWWAVACLVIVSGVWIGTFLAALCDPMKYESMFSSVSTVFTSMVALGGILFGIYKYREDREFSLAMQLPFSREVLEKQKEFYERYVDCINGTQLLLRKEYLNTSGNSVEGHKQKICALREKYEKWFSSEQIGAIKKIEEKYFELSALQNLIGSSKSKVDIERQANNMDTLLDKDFNAWKDELRRVFFVGSIVEKQKRVVVGKNCKIGWG